MMRRRLSAWWMLVASVALWGCSNEPAPLDALWAETTSQISTPTTTTAGVDGHEVVHQRPHLNLLRRFRPQCHHLHHY